ncbi:uncharacterized protein TNCV_4617731 [Trichonephila clavipes]|nr:uncharacterized protein TNCV_4617731 [Trichonephila clavipes]
MPPVTHACTLPSQITVVFGSIRLESYEWGRIVFRDESRYQRALTIIEDMSGGVQDSVPILLSLLRVKQAFNQELCCTWAFGDGPRNFEPWSSDVDDTCAGTPLLTTTPHQREDVSALDRFNVHRCPTRRVFSGTGLELVTRQATIRYLYHSATAAQDPAEV